MLYWKLLTHECNEKFSILVYDIFYTCVWFFPYLRLIFPIPAYGKFPSTNEKSLYVYGTFKSEEEKPYFRTEYLRLFFGLVFFFYFRLKNWEVWKIENSSHQYNNDLIRKSCLSGTYICFLSFFDAYLTAPASL